MGINGLIRQISASASEQAVGLKEVNQAVNQMDQVTQQNAAMVEETTAASVSLNDEAQRLRQLVTRFNISGNGNGVANSALGYRPAQRTAPVEPQRFAARPARRASTGNAAAAVQDDWQEF